MSNDPKTGTSLAISAGLASVLVAALLVALKLWALAETGALSIAASLADSALDLMMSFGAAAAIVYAARPADDGDDHDGEAESCCRGGDYRTCSGGAC